MQQTAHDVVALALGALSGDDDAGETIKKIGAFLQGVKNPESNVLKIRSIAGEVSACLTVLRHREDPQTRALAGAMPRRLLEVLGKLEPQACERLNEQQLLGWLESYAPQQARGKLTLVGIVANILWHGRLCASRAIAITRFAPS